MSSSSSVRAALAAAMLVVALAATEAHAQSRNLAPGFTTRPATSRVVVVPADMELYSLSAGGVPEPRADWTAAAQQHFASILKARESLIRARADDLTEKDMDEFAQLNALHGAVAEAVFVHHMMGMPQLPTKDKQLDWTLGEAVKPLRDKTGADYALFFWIRDSYASAERKAAMVALALLGVGITGGIQIGYASLVDLQTGRVVWFNNLARGIGDLRDVKSAEETVDALLTGFPSRQ